MENKIIPTSFLSILFIINVSIAQTENYSNGYQKGYKEGYCYEDKLNCIEPIPPLSPLPEINENDSYKDGYQRGFIDGRYAKSKKSTNDNNTAYPPSNFGEYIQPIDLKLVAKAMEAKQQRYDVKRSNYQTTLDEAISGSRYWYKDFVQSLSSYEESFSWMPEFKSNLKKFDPDNIVIKYPKNLSFNQANTLIQNLQSNLNSMSEYYEQGLKILVDFGNHPNKIYKGYHKVQSVMDFQYNDSQQKFIETNSIVSTENKPSYLYFFKNYLVFKRPDRSKPNKVAIKYIGLEDGYHKFRDGYNQLIMVTANNVFLQYYHTPNKDGEYTKYTSYLVMGGFEFK